MAVPYNNKKNGNLDFVYGVKKIVVVGAERCGKTSLIFRHLGRTLPQGEQVVPAAEYAGFIQLLGDLPMRIVLWDLPMKDQHTQRRLESYPNSDAIFLCYAIDDPESFQEALTRWLDEIHTVLSGPIILIGLKTDRRSPNGITTVDDDGPAVSSGEAFEAYVEHNLNSNFECSARTNDGVSELFNYVRQLLDG